MKSLKMKRKGVHFILSGLLAMTLAMWGNFNSSLNDGGSISEAKPAHAGGGKGGGSDDGGGKGGGKGKGGGGNDGGGDTPTGSATYSGRAFGVDLSVLDIDVILSDTGELPSSGGAEESALLLADVPDILTLGLLHATTVGQGDRSRSEAYVAALDLSVGLNVITADVLMSQSMAMCDQNSSSINGVSEILGLRVNGKSIKVSGKPNQTIDLILGKLVINEHLSDGPGDITVNGLHVSVIGLADVIISSAHSDIVCSGDGPPACTGGDFVTGGGWITGTPSGERANFGVAGGFKNNGLWGHLTYIDHGSGMKVKDMEITGYQEINSTTRLIEGIAKIQGGPDVDFEVEVSDNGEPGDNDDFSIYLSNGYEASGKLNGGNIQLHVPCH